MQKKDWDKRATAQRQGPALRDSCVAWVALAFFVVTFTGCSYLRPHGSQPKAQIKSLQVGTNGEAGPLTVRSLQLEVMRFADNYAAVVARAADDFDKKVAEPETRLRAAKWKLEQATAAYIDASGPNPIINALDIVVLAAASRMVMEEVVTKFPLGQAAIPLLEGHRMLETNAWTMASRVLKPDQQRELREIIYEWRRNNPHQQNVVGLRFREFITALGRTPQRASSSPTSLFGLLFLDPMASMDPTTAAIEETRNTAERAMYYAQRMPTLLNWQVEVLTYELAVQPETKELLAATSRFSKTSEVFAKTAEQLPKVISEQREAAIQQLLDGLQPNEEKARGILSEARSAIEETGETLKVGHVTADSVNATIRTLDQFVRYVTKTNEGRVNRRPFDVLDYAATARDIGTAAKDLSALLVSANDGAAQLAHVRQQTVTDARGVVDHAFARALTLVLVLVCGALLTGIVVVSVGSRRRSRPLSGNPNGRERRRDPTADCQK